MARTKNKTENFNTNEPLSSAQQMVNNGLMYEKTYNSWKNILNLNKEKSGKCDISQAFQSAYMTNPWIQSSRLKRLNPQASRYNREQIEAMLLDPYNNEELIQKASSYFYNTVSPIMKIYTLFADILSYRTYVNVEKLTNSSKIDKEYSQVLDIVKAINPKRTFRNIVLNTIKFGKTAYYLRMEGSSICFQRLPNEWIKVTGSSSDGWVISINMMYFLTPGVSVEFFAPEFKEYLDEFFCYYDKENELLDVTNLPKDVNAYLSKGSYYFWKRLLPDKCFVFSAEDGVPEIMPPFSSSFLEASELSTYRILQQELLSIPLSSILVGEIPMSNKNVSGQYVDDMSISPDMVALFTELIQKKLPAATSYISTPFQNNKLYEFSDVATRTDIVGEATNNFYNSSGLGSLLYSSEKPTLSQVKSAQKIQASFSRNFYEQFSYVMNMILKKFNFYNKFCIHIEGDIFSDDEDRKFVTDLVKNGMGDLIPKLQSYNNTNSAESNSTLEYIKKTGYYNKLTVLVPSKGNEKDLNNNPVGRPGANEDEVESDATAAGIEAGSNTAEGRVVNKNMSKSYDDIINLLSEDDIEEFKDILEDIYGYEDDKESNSEYNG